MNEVSLTSRRNGPTLEVTDGTYFIATVMENSTHPQVFLNYVKGDRLPGEMIVFGDALGLVTDGRETADYPLDDRDTAIERWVMHLRQETLVTDGEMGLVYMVIDRAVDDALEHFEPAKLSEEEWTD